MKAFFSNILKDKPQQPQQQQQTNQANAAAPTAAGQLAAAAASATAGGMKAAAAGSPAAIASSPATVLSPAASGVGASPPAAASTPLLPAVSSNDRKHARLLLESYVGVVQTVFDHSQPLRAEQDSFVRKMDGWIGGRDAAAELPKAQYAARVSGTGSQHRCNEWRKW